MHRKLENLVLRLGIIPDGYFTALKILFNYASNDDNM